MTSPRHMMTLLAAALLLAGLVGCSDQETNPVGTADTAVDDYASMDFSLPYGGLTKTDEDPAFGDAYLMQDDALEGEEIYEDELADDPEVAELERMGEMNGDGNNPLRPRFTFLRMVWGNLDGEVDEKTGLVEDGEGVDWSGLLRVDRGIVLVRRVIRFERPYDLVVRPHIDRHTVAWFSQTGDHFDGLLIQIIEPPHTGERDGDDPPPPNQLHFVTGPFEQSFPVSELAELDEIFEVEPAGNAIHFAGFILGDLDTCPKGFLSGIWCDDLDTDDGSGFFRGRWVARHGLGMGHMQGAYGFNDEGERVFFGKYITRNGGFIGLLAGTWKPGDRPGHGGFRGHWVSEDDTREGVLGGRYLQPSDRPGGFYQGRWATDCDQEAVDQIR